MLGHRSVCRMLQKTPEMHEWPSGQFDFCLFFSFFIIQYFLSHQGISVTFDNFISNIKKITKQQQQQQHPFKPFDLLNDFALKCLLRSTDMHEIDHTYLFLSFLSFSKVIWGSGWGEGGGGDVLLYLVLNFQHF